MDFPTFPPENGYRRDDYIVGCPDLIESLSLHSRLSPLGNGLLKNLVWLLIFFFFFWGGGGGGGDESADGMEQGDFRE